MLLRFASMPRGDHLSSAKTDSLLWHLENLVRLAVIPHYIPPLLHG